MLYFRAVVFFYNGFIINILMVLIIIILKITLMKIITIVIIIRSAAIFHRVFTGVPIMTYFLIFIVLI